MIDGITATRTALLNPVIKPYREVYLRRLLPGWNWHSTSASSYIEEPDLIDTGMYNYAVEGASGDFVTSYSGWKEPIPGDSAQGNDYIIRCLAPAALGDTVNDNYIMFYRVTDVTNASQFSVNNTSKNLTGDAIPKAYCRPGMVYDDSRFRCYYIGAGGSVYYLYSDATAGTWTGPNQVSSSDYYDDVLSATIAPVGTSEWFVYYMKADDRRMYLDYYDSGYVFREKVIGYNYDEDIHWSTTHWFDAVPLYNRNYIIANTSKYGTSRGHWVFDDNVSGPLSVLPFDEVDWTGFLHLSSLSVIGGRMYAVARQRFLEGDGNYSRPLWTILWSSDGFHWAQARQLAIGTSTIKGKVLTLSDKVFIVSPASSMIGEKTVDFGGGDTNVQIDISDAVTDFAVEFKRNQGGLAKHSIQASKMTEFALETSWLPMADQIVTKFGTSASDVELFDVSHISGPEQALAINQDKILVMSRGSFSVMMDNKQFTDEILNRSVEMRFDMDRNDIINRASSTWDAVDGALWTLLPNGNDESFAMGASPLAGDFEIKARMLYQEDATSFGLVFWAGSDQGNIVYEDPDHFNYMLLFTPQGSDTCTTELWQRTSAQDEDGVWTDELTKLDDGSNVTWEVDRFRPIRIQYTEGQLDVWQYDGSWHNILTYNPSELLPKQFLAGIYAKTLRAEVSESTLSGNTTLPVDDIDDWPDSGTAVIAGTSYGYTKTDAQTMELDGELEQYASEGRTITLDKSRIACDWLQIANGEQRWCVAEICQHMATRSGIEMSVDTQVATEPSMYSIQYGTVGYYDGDSVWFSGSAMISSGVSLADSMVQMNYSNLDTGDILEFRWAAGTDDYSGTGLRIDQFATYSQISLCSYSSSDLDSYTMLTGSPTWQMPSSGSLRVVVFEGWAHFYCNYSHLGSLYDSSLENAYGELRIAGKNATVTYAEILVGNAVMYPGIWDSGVTAKQALSELINGRSLVITESNNMTLRLESEKAHDDLGTTDLDLVINFGFGRQYLATSSAMVFQGGYSWVIDFDDAMMRETGLVWGKMENHSMLSTESLRNYAAQQSAINRGSVRSYNFGGRLDLAMRPNDKFTIPAHGPHVERTYIVDNFSVTSSHNVLTVQGQAIGVAPAVDSMEWDVDTWDDNEWS